MVVFDWQLRFCSLRGKALKLGGLKKGIMHGDDGTEVMSLVSSR